MTQNGFDALTQVGDFLISFRCYFRRASKPFLTLFHGVQKVFLQPFALAGFTGIHVSHLHTAIGLRIRIILFSNDETTSVRFNVSDDKRFRIIRLGKSVRNGHEIMRDVTPYTIINDQRRNTTPPHVRVSNSKRKIRNTTLLS